MKSSLSSMLDDLAVRFRDRSRRRVEEMASLLDRQDIAGLAHHFHGLAGLGATYGFAEVSRLGDEGEGILIAIRKETRPATPKELETLRTLIEELRRALTPAV
jgi:HPt (histidine-containing phosphotransfer) domain-containing protein